MGFLVVGKVRTPYIMAGWLCISLGAGCGMGSGLWRRREQEGTWLVPICDFEF